MTLENELLDFYNEEDDAQEEKPKKQDGGKYANWCRTEGHPANCTCEYPDPSEIVPMRGAAPGTRPMPRDLNG